MQLLAVLLHAALPFTLFFPLIISSVIHVDLPSAPRRLPNPYLLPSGDRFLFFDRTGSVLVQPRNPFDFVFNSLPATYKTVTEKMLTEGSARHSSWDFEETVEGRRRGTEDYCRLEVFNTPNPALGLGWNDTVSSDVSSSYFLFMFFLCRFALGGGNLPRCLM